MSTDFRPLRPVTISIPGQRARDGDLLAAGGALADAAVPDQPRRRRLAGLGALAAAGLLGAAAAGGLPWAPAPVAPAPEPVRLALLTPAPTASASASAGTPASFVTLRVRVAVRNDSASWVTLEDASLGAYRATGDGLGALPPGGLTSVPLERLVVCDAPATAPAPSSLDLQVMAATGPAEVRLDLVQTAGTHPATLLPACT